ncbi:MAG: hypothetical protein ABIH89_04155 [Elusimicrobiota bacterium]
MKWGAILFCSFIITACSGRHAAFDISFGGVMTFAVTGSSFGMLSSARGVFKVDGPEDRFSIYFQDEYGQPLGKVIVEKNSITEKELSVDGYSEIFRYWRHLFSDNRKRADIEYSDYVTVSGKELPGRIMISRKKTVIDIRIVYGIQGAGKD